MSAADGVRVLIAPLLGDLGLEVVDVEHHHGVLRVTIDHPDGLGTELLTQASRSISAILDEADPVGASYTLEVTSPGLERKLRSPDHYRRAVGEQVSIKTVPGTEGERRSEGELVSSDASSLVLRLADGSERRLAYDEVQTARTVFEWSTQPKPGRGRAEAKKAAAS